MQVDVAELEIKHAKVCCYICLRRLSLHLRASIASEMKSGLDSLQTIMSLFSPVLGTSDHSKVNTRHTEGTVKWTRG